MSLSSVRAWFAEHAPDIEVLVTETSSATVADAASTHNVEPGQIAKTICVRAGERVMRSITDYLHTTLKLRVNPAKSKVAPMSECSFLGFTLAGTKIRWTDKVLADFKHRVRELTGRSWGVSMDYRLHKLGQYLRGWFGYFGISQYWRPIPELDEWIRRRVRMCYWKQWRWVRTKVRHLLDLGLDLKTAIQHAASSKSYWHMARTPGLQQALSNAWLKAQGLVSVRDLWCKAQGYAK